MTEIITEGPMGIGFISGGAGILSMNQLADEQIRYLVRGLAELDRYADVILIDTGAGISNRGYGILWQVRKYLLLRRRNRVL